LQLIQSILMVRLNDKAQAVRSIAIQSCSFFFPELNVEYNNEYKELFSISSGDTDADIDTDTDDSIDYRDDLVHALVWSLSHDPSFANRSMALQSIPVHKDTTMQYIVERVRDDKVKVRTDALDILRKVDVKNDLTVEMRCDILRHGLSSR
jgi:hypothetical protein